MGYELILDDILHWAATYEGPLFHAAFMDPPYHLTIEKRFGKPGSKPAKVGVYNRASKGFMNQSWDGTDDSGLGIAFRPETWAALSQHLHPGGFIVAFAGCYDEQTEVLTRRGWVKFPDVTSSDVFATLNPETHKVEWLQSIEIVNQPHYGPMLHFENNRVDLLVTPNHKMFVAPLHNDNYGLVRADQLKKAIKVTKTSQGRIDATDSDFVLPSVLVDIGHGHSQVAPELTIPLEAWIPFMGLWMAEGSASIRKVKTGYGYAVSICHFELDNLYKIRDLLSPYFNISIYPEQGKLQIFNKQLVVYLSQFGRSYDKFIPQFIKELSPCWIRLFLDWYARGDGDDRGNIYTCSPRLRDDVQEIAMYAGYAADWKTASDKKKLGTIKGRTIHPRRPHYVIRLLKAQITPELYQRADSPPIMEVVNSEAWAGKNVYCVELPKYHTLYVRRNGKAVWCGNTRGYHRMAGAMEDSGLIIHPAMVWTFLSGFPKSTRIDTQLDKRGGNSLGWFGPYLREWREKRGIPQKELSKHFPSKTGGLTGCVANWELGLNTPSVEQYNKLVEVLGLPFRTLEEAEREIIGYNEPKPSKGIYGEFDGNNITAPATPLAQTWAGHRYGLQALKPALEFIAVAQKPYVGRPVDCITRTGAGAWNIDQARIPADDKTEFPKGYSRGGYSEGWPVNQGDEHPNGRWPANLLLDEAGGALLDRQSGESASRSSDTPQPRMTSKGIKGGALGNVERRRPDGHEVNEDYTRGGYNDSGGASRMFFQSTWQYEILEQLENADPLKYEPKVSTAEREAGLDSLPLQTRNRVNSGGYEADPKFAPTQMKNNHPTLKPISLTKYLATLLLPPDAYAPRRICVPFGGAGSEAIGCVLAGWESVTVIESSPDYVPIADARLAWWSQWPGWGQTDVDKILASIEPKEETPQATQLSLLPDEDTQARILKALEAK